MDLEIKNILVIDDNNLFNNQQKNLHNTKYNLIYSSNIKHIISSLYDKTIDLIILDINFPMGSYKLLEIIRRHKRTKNIPLIMLLPNLDVKDISSSYKYGADLCLGKPILLDDLLLSISCLTSSNIKQIV